MSKNRNQRTPLRPQNTSSFNAEQQRIVDGIYDVLEANDIKARNATDFANRAGQLASLARSTAQALVRPVEVKEVVGAIEVTNIQTDVLVEWSDIQVILRDRTRFTVADGQFAYEIDYTEQDPEPRIFYYDKARNTITSNTLEAWLDSDEAYDIVNYTELFSVVQNTNVDRISDPAAPFVSVFPKQIATGLFAAKEANVDASIEEMLTAFENSIIAIVGSHINQETSAIALGNPLRIDLPKASRLLLVSGKEPYFIELSAIARAGDTSISIKSQYIEAYKGAKIVHDQVSQQSQLQISPEKVLIQAQSAAGNASSALSLITTANSAINTLTTNLSTTSTNASNALTQISTANSAITTLESALNGIDLSAIATLSTSVTAVEGEVDTIQATTIMRASVGAGNVASITVSAIDGTNPTTNIKIAGANIDLAGLVTIWNADSTDSTRIDGGRLINNSVTTNELNADVVNAVSAIVVGNSTFISDVASAIDGSTFSGIAVYKGATTPTGGTYVIGDRWLKDTQVGGVARNLPHVWDGSAWIREFTVIVDGDFQTGSINANKIIGDDLSSLRATTGFLTVNDRIIVGVDGFIRGNSYEPSLVGTGSGFYLGAAGNVYQLAVGNGKKYIHYDGTELLIGEGKIVEAVTFTGTAGRFETIEDALNGTTNGGAVMSTAGFFAGEAGQTTATSNIRVLSNGSAFIKGEIEADSGILGNLTVSGALTLGSAGGITSSYTAGNGYTKSIIINRDLVSVRNQINADYNIVYLENGALNFSNKVIDASLGINFDGYITSTRGIQGHYKSSDGSAGFTGSILGTETAIVKDGIITGKS